MAEAHGVGDIDHREFRFLALVGVNELSCGLLDTNPPSGWAKPMQSETPFIESLRASIEEQYAGVRLGSGSVGGCFGSILCHELHAGGLHFVALARKWGISLHTLGELIWDHCRRLEPLPEVNHDLQSGELAATIAERAAVGS